MDWETQPACSVREVLDYLKDDETMEEDVDYRVVSDVVDAMSRMAETYIGAPVVNQSITERLDGDTIDVLNLLYLPVSDLSTVEELQEDGSYLDITTEVDFYDDGAIFRKDGMNFLRGRKRYRVTYTAGRGSDVSKIPSDIRHAVKQMAAHIIKTDIQRYSDMLEEQNNLEWISKIPYGAIKILDRYQIIRIGS